MSEPNTPSDEPAAPGLGEDVPSRAEEDDLTRAEQIENERTERGNQQHAGDRRGPQQRR